MNNEYFAEMHKLIEKAKSYERMGREEEALRTYLEIHEKFFPNTSDLFERPAILLEKRKRFDEAIRICEKAIKLIGEGKITGVKDNFERRIQRIKSRSDYDGELKHGKANVSGDKKEPFKLFRRRFKEVKAVEKTEPETRDKDMRNEAVLKETPTSEPIRHRVKPIKEMSNEKEAVPEPAPVITPSTVQAPPTTAPKSVPDVTPTPVPTPIPTPALTLEPAPVPTPTPTPEPDQVPVLEIVETDDSVVHRKNRRQIKWPKLHLRLPNLNDFKHMIADIKNFKWSDMKFFIFDFSEIKNGTFKFRKPTKSEWLALGLIVGIILILALAIANKPKSQFEIAFDTSAFEWSQDITTDLSEENKKDLPPITATMIDTAVKETQSMPGVRMAGVVVQKNVVGFIIMTTPEADRRQAKEAAEKMIKSLASAAAAENKDLRGPGPIGYGELFDYYALLVVAGENYDNLLLKGSKNPKAPGVYWRNEEK